MKLKNPLALLFAWLGLALAPAQTVAAAESSPSSVSPTTLSGLVTNSATGRTLEGALVVIQGTGRQALTDNQGVYRFTDVAAGSATLSVSYTGLTTVEIPVVVAAGTAGKKDVGLTADIYTLSKFVVSSEREGNAQAITLQRLSEGVKSIVSADAFGSLAGNVGDLAMRLPGVQGESVGGDIRFIHVRGLHQNLLTVTVNGDRVASATSGGGDRGFEFSQTNADAIERLEVVKSPTPDMDGDSIGGAVNMVSKSAFDSSPERRVSGSIGASWRARDARDKGRATYSLAYSEVFGGRFGVSINAGHRQHNSLIDLASQNYEQLATGVMGPAYSYNVSIFDFRAERTRAGVGVKLDYKYSDSTRFYVNWQFSKYYEHCDHSIGTWTTGQAVATRDANGNFTGTGGIIPGYTDNMTEIRPVASSTFTIQSNNLYQDGRLHTAQAGGVHRYKNLNIDYSAYQSHSKINYTGIFAPTMTVRNIGFRIEKGSDPYFPTVTQTAGADITQMSSYTENTVPVTRNATWDDLRGAALNVKKQFETTVPTYIKAGFRWRGQERQLVSTPWTGTYVGPDGVAGVNPATGTNDDNLAQFLAYRPLKGNYSKYPNYPRILNNTDWPSVKPTGTGMPPALQKTPQYFVQNVALNVQSTLTGNTKFKEDISAYYVMGNIDLGKLSVLGGVRVETTTSWGEGALQAISADEKARRAAWVGPVTVAEDVRRRTSEFGGRLVREGENRVVLPGIHFKFSPLPMLITRLSYQTNIGRPGPGQLVPNTTVNYDARTVSSSNPSLRPQTANNFDFTAEYYFEPAGVITAGVFLKELKNFIYTAGGALVPSGQENGFGGEYAGFTYTSQYNGGFAKVKGVEISYSQQFTFLPGFWSGFGAYANLTKLQAEGNYGAGAAVALAPTSKIAGFNPTNGNVGISYIRNRASVRLQLNYRGRYLTTFNVNESRLVYLRPRPMVSLKLNYRISKNFDAYMDLANVTDTPDGSSEFGGGRVGTMTYLYPQFLFGLNGRL